MVMTSGSLRWWTQKYMNWSNDVCECRYNQTSKGKKKTRNSSLDETDQRYGKIQLPPETCHGCETLQPLTTVHYQYGISL